MGWRTEVGLNCWATRMKALDNLDIIGLPLLAPVAIIALMLIAIRHAWKHEKGYGFLFWLIVILFLPVAGSLGAFLFLPTTKRWSVERAQKKQAADKSE